MSKKGTKALASATLMSLVLTTALSAGPVKAAAGSVTRIGEADRYATAAKVATANWTTSDNVVLVSGEGYADAVSASALAKKLNAPILLTTAGSLNADAKAALSTLKAKNIYVVGGNASVSQSVRNDLKANYTLVELQGANRYETNVAVAKQLVKLGVDPSNVMMVGGEGFSDALSVAPIAAAKGQILLLGNNNSDSMKSVIDFVNTNKSKVTVVGTSNVISDSILSSVNGTRVNGGSDRFDTNLKVLAAFNDSVKMDSLYVANASGNGYADALVASALAGKTAAPLVLVGAEGENATTNAIAYIKANAKQTTDLNVVGGTGVVSDTTVGQINDAVKPATPVFSGSITSVETVKDQYVNSQATDETLKFTVNGGTQVTAADIVKAGYSIDFTADSSVFETSAGTTSKDGILDKAKVQTFLGSNSNKDFNYSVKVSKNGQIIGQTGNEKVHVINGDQTANTLSDITVKQGHSGSETTKITSGKLVKNEYATVTKVKGSIGSASDVTISNKKFYSSNPFVATVNESTGEIHTVNAGNFTLTIKSGSISKDYSFTVVDDTRKVTSATAAVSSLKLGKAADTTFDLTLKDQFGDTVNADSNKQSTDDMYFQVNSDVKDGSTTIAAVTANTTTTDTDGKVTLTVKGSATNAGNGNLKVYNKDGVMFTLPVQVTGDTSIDNIKIEAAANDSDSNDLTLDLNPKAADNNGDSYVRLNVNKYSSNGTYLGKATDAQITITTDSNKKILSGGNTVSTTPDGKGYFAIRIPFATAGASNDTGADNNVDLLTNGFSASNVSLVDTGTITVTAKLGDKTTSITLNVKDTTPSISANLNNSISTTTPSGLAIKDIVKASDISASLQGLGDGKIRIANDGTIFAKSDNTKYNTLGSNADIDDASIGYDAVHDIILGKIVATPKSGDITGATVSNGKITFTGSFTNDSYATIGVMRVHDTTPFTTMDVKVKNN